MAADGFGLIHCLSWPGLSRLSHASCATKESKMDARDIGERSDAVLRTAIRGHDDSISIHFASGFRSRTAGQVILSRPRVDRFDLFDLLPRGAAHSPFLRFGHSPRSFQFRQGFV